MKQGKADSSGPGAQKVEPICRPVNPGAVAEIGAREAGYIPPLYSGPPHQGPAPSGTTVHRSGGQGKH